MLKAGVLGAGHLGKIHLRLLNQSEKYNLVGFYDANPENAPHALPGKASPARPISPGWPGCRGCEFARAV